MKITVGLNTKSIRKAVKALETAKKQLNDTMVKELLVACCQRIANLANDNLDKLDLGEVVKRGIQNSWVISEVNKGNITLTNNWHIDNGEYQTATVYVEFGVGIVGSQNPHPETNSTGYIYNYPSASKSPLNDSWWFYSDKIHLDLPRNAYNISRDLGDRLLVNTRGTQATRFVYNAVMEFVENDEAKKLWQQIKKKYWG